MCNTHCVYCIRKVCHGHNNSNCKDRISQLEKPFQFKSKKFVCQNLLDNSHSEKEKGPFCSYPLSTVSLKLHTLKNLEKSREETTRHILRLKILVKLNNFPMKETKRPPCPLKADFLLLCKSTFPPVVVTHFELEDKRKCG